MSSITGFVPIKYYVLSDDIREWSKLEIFNGDYTNRTCFNSCDHSNLAARNPDSISLLLIAAFHLHEFFLFIYSYLKSIITVKHKIH